MSERVPKSKLLPLAPMEPLVLSEQDRRKPITVLIRELVGEVPPEERLRVPHDRAENHDHYLYGAPRLSHPE